MFLVLPYGSTEGAPSVIFYCITIFLYVKYVILFPPLCFAPAPFPTIIYPIGLLTGTPIPAQTFYKTIFHTIIIAKWQLGVSLSLIDECGGAPRRRRQAHAFNLPKTTNLKELNRRKDSDKTRGGGQGVLR